MRSGSRPSSCRDEAGPQAAAATGAALVLGQLADYFGADRDRQLVRLRFGDGVRYLRRGDIYSFLGTTRKGFGDSGRAALPGTPHQVRLPSTSSAAPSTAARTARYSSSPSTRYPTATGTGFPLSWCRERRHHRRGHQ